MTSTSSPRSVVPQLSTMPAWLYEGAKNYSFIGDPWSYPRGFSEYEQTKMLLKDPTGRAMARYTARYVSWHTAGGMTDECGVWLGSHCRFVLAHIRFIPDLLRYSVPLFLKRQCERTLGPARVRPLLRP